MSEENPVLEVEALSKSYRDVHAVINASLKVGEHEIVCLLGPNGSGKTTLIECVEGLREPDQGSIRILGRGMSHGHRRPKEVGVQLQEEGLPSRIKVREAVELFRRIYQVKTLPERLLEQLGLTDLMDKKFETLSGGQKRRTALALAFINSPKLAILDEPTSGLDPEGQRVVVDLLRDSAASGSGILATMHDMKVASEVADTVVVMRHGAVMTSGSPSELVANLPYDSCLMVPEESALDGLTVPSQVHVHRNPDGGVHLYGGRDALTEIWNGADARVASGLNLRGTDLSDVSVFLKLEKGVQ